jgi:hypothetical protein
MHVLTCDHTGLPVLRCSFLRPLDMPEAFLLPLNAEHRCLTHHLATIPTTRKRRHKTVYRQPSKALKGAQPPCHGQKAMGLPRPNTSVFGMFGPCATTLALRIFAKYHVYDMRPALSSIKDEANVRSASHPETWRTKKRHANVFGLEQRIMIESRTHEQDKSLTYM